MRVEVFGVLENTISSRAEQFVLTIAAGEHADSQHAGPARGQEIPDGIADRIAFVRRDAEALLTFQKEVRFGFGLGRVRPVHYNRPSADAERASGGFHFLRLAGCRNAMK